MSQTVLYDAPGPRARRQARIASAVALLAISGGAAWLVLALGAERTTSGGMTLPGLWDASRWDIFADPAVWRSLGEGVLATLRMAAVASVLALALAVALSLLRLAENRWLRVPVTVIVEFFRGMPVLLMMLFVLLVFSTGTYWAGVVALTVYNAATIGEALRAGILALPRGQREAGLAIGMTPLATRLRIELPQAVRHMAPVIIGQLVVLLKDTSLAYIVGYTELLRQGGRLQNYFGGGYTFTLFFVVLAIYLVLNLSLSWVARRMARGRR